MSGPAQGRGRGESLKPTDLRLLGSPLDFLHEDHLRERVICAMIDRLAAAPDPEGAARVAEFLTRELPLHLADEEEDFFPLMRRRCTPEDEIDRALERLGADRRHFAAETPAVVAILRAIEDAAPPAPEARARLGAYAARTRRHLILENAVLLPLARARLGERDLDRLRLRMLRRRGLDHLMEG